MGVLEAQNSSIMKVLFDGSKVATESHKQSSVPVFGLKRYKLDCDGYPFFVLCASGFTRNKEGDATSEISAASPSIDVDRMECKLSLRGMPNVSNACSAAAVGYLAGMSLEEIVAALEHQCQRVEGRKFFIPTRDLR